MGNIDFFGLNRLQDLRWIHCQYRLEEKIDDVKVLDKEKELATDDGDTRGDTEEKTQNDSDMESDEWKYDLNNVDVFYGREEKCV